MDSIKISVIVPVYKTEKYIRQCLNSIINQTYRELEIILVDDGSPDNCGIICEEYAIADNRIKVIHKENGGLVSARKAGVSSATGDYITFVDSDDWIDEGAYAHAVGVLSDGDIDSFIFGLNRVSENSCLIEHENINEGLYNRQLLFEEICKLDKEDIFYKKIFSTVTWNKLFKSEIIKYNIVNVDNLIRIGEDAALVYPSLLDSKSFYITHSTYYNYRKNNNSMMNSYDSERYKSVDKVKKTVFNAVKKHNLQNNKVIMHQMLLYVFDLMLITDTSHYFKNIKELYPQIEDGSKILFYGKGVFAHNLKFLAQKNGNVKVAGYIDSASVDEIVNFEFDYIIIAVTIAQFVEEILCTLQSIGIDMNKVLYLTNDIAI